MSSAQQSIIPLLMMAGVIFALAAGATRLAMQMMVFDEPNSRSSHDHTVPKSGGVAVIGVWALTLFVIYSYTGARELGIARAQYSSFMALVIMVAILSLADDIMNINAIFKLGAQIIAASVFAFGIESMTYIFLPYLGRVEVGGMGYFVTIVWIVTFMNVFNFMDGINGLAAGCAVIACVIILSVDGGNTPYMLFLNAFILGPALLGFLIFNFPKAQIFLGDNGSQPLGLMFASLAVFGAKQGDFAVTWFVIPTIFLPFIFDVAVTLVHRIIRRQPIFEAHREHLYQLLHRSGYSHAAVSMIYFLMVGFCGLVAVLMHNLAEPSWRLWLLISLLPALCGFAMFVFFEAQRSGVIGPMSSGRNYDDLGDDIKLGANRAPAE